MAMNHDYLERTAAELRRQNLDALLIAPSPDMWFLLSHVPLFCYRFQGLFVTKEGGCFYVCNLLTAEEMRAVLPEYKVYAWRDGEDFVAVVEEALREHGLLGGRIGVNPHVRACNVLAITARLDVTFTDGRDICPEVRIRKTAHEIDCMQRAARMAERALSRVVKEIRAGQTERQVRQLLVEYMRQEGAGTPSALVASGPNSGYPHYNEDSRVLQTGDTVLIDFSCDCEGLRTDITRTFFLGEPTPRQRELYELTRRANEAAEEALRRGTRWIPDVDEAARGVIDEGGYGAFFTTRLGHGIGYMGHEAPDIKRNNERMLEPGMSFTIEPGIYLGGDSGVRVEDCLVIDLDGQPRILTDGFTKELLIVG